jgi:hypothetical protein
MSDIASNDDLPALEIVAPFDARPLDVPCAGISRDAMVTAAPTPSAEDQQLTDPFRPQAGATCACGDLTIQSGHRQLPLDDWVRPLLEREQAEARLPVRGGLAVEWKKVRTEDQGSAEDVITGAKEAPATKMFASEAQAEEKALLAKDTDSKPRKDSWSGLDIPHREMQDLLANGFPFLSRPIAHTRGKWPAEDVITAAKEAPATKMVASEAQAEEKVLLTKDTDSKPRKNSWLDRWDIQDRKIRELLANDDPFSDRALGGDKWISAEASVARPAHRLVADLPCVGAGYQDGGEPGGDEDLGCQTNADLGVSVYGSKDENEEDEEDEEDGGEEDEEYKEEEEEEEEEEEDDDYLIHLLATNFESDED